MSNVLLLVLLIIVPTILAKPCKDRCLAKFSPHGLELGTLYECYGLDEKPLFEHNSCDVLHHDSGLLQFSKDATLGPTLGEKFSQFLKLGHHNGNWGKVLGRIDLSHHEIEEMAGSAWSQTRNVKEIDLSHNLLRVISSESFSKLRRLEALDLSWNKIEQIDEQAWQEVRRSLKYLYLNHNSLTTLSQSHFGSYNTVLRFLAIGNNPLDSAKLKFENDLRLEASNLGLKEIRANAVRGVVLESDASKEIELSLHEPMELQLSQNEIAKLKDDVFEHTGRLKILNVSSNGLEEIQPESLSNLRFLNTIDLSHNKLKVIPANLFEKVNPPGFVNRFGLCYLNLAHNQIEELSPDLFNDRMATSMDKLYLDHNKLKKLEINFGKFLRLKNISLGGNRFSCDEERRVREDLKNVRVVKTKIVDEPISSC